MTRAELLARLRELKPWLDGEGVAQVRVFGSFARDAAGPDSDVDLLVTFMPGRTPDLFTFAGLKLALEERLGRPVDLLTPGSIHPALRSRIEGALIDAREGLASPDRGHDRTRRSGAGLRGRYGRGHVSGRPADHHGGHPLHGGDR